MSEFDFTAATKKLLFVKRLADIRGKALAYFDRIRKDERLWK